LAGQAADSLEQINNGARETMKNIEAIATSLSQQSIASQDIADHVNKIMSMAEINTNAAEKALHEASQLEHISTNLKEIGNVFKLGMAGEKAIEIHSQMPLIVQSAAKAISNILDNAVDSGKITVADLFDDKYQPVPNTKPQKYKTRFDDVADKVLTNTQEQIVEQNKAIVFAITCDRKGYVPTHNRRFTQPLTGDEKVDAANNRTKRIFSDPVGSRCGNHEQLSLLQTYRRDTGEVIHDISAPVYVKGRHWGGFRIGYRTEV
jgi:methyl-accepting chemotaxis protein